jgi:hypothetical protein
MMVVVIVAAGEESIHAAQSSGVSGGVKAEEGVRGVWKYRCP